MPKQKFAFVKDKGGSRAQPDLPGPWELVAQTAEEFRELGETWSASRNRGERDLAQWVQEHVLPLLAVREEELEKRQRRQQRLRRQIGSNAAAVAAPLGERRSRRPMINYAQDEYDRQIKQAIKQSEREAEERAQTKTGGGRRAVVEQVTATQNGEPTAALCSPPSTLPPLYMYAGLCWSIVDEQ